MKFTLTNDLKQNALMRLIIIVLVFFTLIYLLADIFVKYKSFGISVSTVKLTLFGDEDEFIEPLPEVSFLEFIHSEIFFIMMILFTLSIVFIRVATKSKINFVIINTTMMAAIVSLIALGLSFYLSEIFVYIYIISFFLWHTLGIYISLYTLWKLR